MGRLMARLLLQGRGRTGGEAAPDVPQGDDGRVVTKTTLVRRASA
jgi:hypothetical protein